MENLVVYKYMSFNKKMVRSLEDLKKEFEELGEEQFVRIYSKPDTLLGPSDSIEFINSKINQSR